MGERSVDASVMGILAYPCLEVVECLQLALIVDGGHLTMTVDLLIQRPEPDSANEYAIDYVLNDYVL